MSFSTKVGISIAAALGLLLPATVYVRTHTIAVLEPQGLIAAKELGLMIDTTLLMLIVAVPIFMLATFFAWWYRAKNSQALYSPEWEHGPMTELVWWAIPLEIILILGALTWSSTHELDPHRPLDIEGAPITIEVVALTGKWLFIYPEEKIATINFVQIPIDRPIRFLITADAPMNSFWIPQLGGQIYAMTGMSTTLNLVAQKAGEYAGLSANYSGPEFAHMKFTVKASSESDFNSWVSRVQASALGLRMSEYNRLIHDDSFGATFYGSVDDDLYDTILMKYNAPAHHH